MEQRKYLGSKCLCCTKPKEKGSVNALCKKCASYTHNIEAVRKYEDLRAEGYGSHEARVKTGLC
jgi:Zn finger protein HypA/HybF involved in hydrogenase expression